jgi:uncharacterized protein (TIGR03000 family)
MKLQPRTFLAISQIVFTTVLLVGTTNPVQAQGHGGGVRPAVAVGRGGCYGGRCGYGYGGYGYRGGYGCGWGWGWGVGVGWGWGWGYPYPVYADYPYYPNGYPACQAPGYPPPAGGAAPSSGVTGAPNLPGAPTGDAALTILVPADALVWVNGEKTTQSGPRRDFVSSGLAPGRSYTFEVRTEWKGQDGRPVDLVQRIPMQAGDKRAISISIPHIEVSPVSAGVVH